MGVETIQRRSNSSATPAMTDNSPLIFSLPAVSRKKVTAAFDGGRLSSDSGVILVSLAERRRAIARTLAALIDERRTATRAVRGGLRLMLLDQVFGLAACTIERRVDEFGAAFVQRGDDVADIEASAQHIVFLGRAGLDTRHGAAFPGPGFCGIVCLGIATQRGMLAFSPAHPDIVGDGLHEPVEDSIAGKPKDVIDAVRLTPAHRLLAAVMAVAADGDVRVGPMPTHAADEAAQPAANFLARWRFAGAED